MVANENYWDGAVPFKTVEIPSIDDPNTRAMSLQSGDVDMAVNIGPGEIGLFQNNDKFKVDEIASLRVVLARINQKVFLVMTRFVQLLFPQQTVKTMPMYC